MGKGEYLCTSQISNNQNLKPYHAPPIRVGPMGNTWDPGRASLRGGPLRLQNQLMNTSQAPEVITEMDGWQNCHTRSLAYGVRAVTLVKANWKPLLPLTSTLIRTANAAVLGRMAD
jgi:hypothetical protein